jgi:hypothetical protein
MLTNFKSDFHVVTVMIRLKNSVMGIAMAALMAGAALAIIPIQTADATKIRNCTTGTDPKGVDSTNNWAWVSIDGGKIQRFSLSSCSVTDFSSGITGDPHFLAVSSDTSKVAFTEHASHKVGYLNPGTNTVIECTNSNINGPDDIDFWTGTNQYFTSYNNGKLIRSSLSGSSCTFTSYTLPGTGPNPEGIDRSSDANGFFVVDEDPTNKKLYKFDQSTGSFTLCRTFTAVPWFVAVSDASDLMWVTFNAEKRIRAVGTLSCLVAETSPSTTGLGSPFDVAIAQGGVDAYVTFNDNSEVRRFKTSTHTWSTPDNWSTECSTCFGFGIDESASSDNTYYAAMRGPTTSKLVVGSITG